MTDDSLGICLRCTLYTGPHHSKVLHHASCIYECLWMIVCFKLPASFGRTIALGQVVWKHVMRHNVELDSTWPCHDLKVIGWIWNLFGFYLFNQPFHLQGTFYWVMVMGPRVLSYHPWHTLIKFFLDMYHATHRWTRIDPSSWTVISVDLTGELEKNLDLFLVTDCQKHVVLYLVRFGGITGLGVAIPREKKLPKKFRPGTSSDISLNSSWRELQENVRHWRSQWIFQKVLKKISVWSKVFRTFPKA